jgi:hypothetical protein
VLTEALQLSDMQKEENEQAATVQQVADGLYVRSASYVAYASTDLAPLLLVFSSRMLCLPFLQLHAQLHLQRNAAARARQNSAL